MIPKLEKKVNDLSRPSTKPKTREQQQLIEDNIVALQLAKNLQKCQKELAATQTMIEEMLSQTTQQETGKKTEKEKGQAPHKPIKKTTTTASSSATAATQPQHKTSEEPKKDKETLLTEINEIIERLKRLNSLRFNTDFRSISQSDMYRIMGPLKRAVEQSFPSPTLGKNKGHYELDLYVQHPVVTLGYISTDIKELDANKFELILDALKTVESELNKLFNK